MLAVEFDRHQPLLLDEEFGHLDGVVAPDLRRDQMVAAAAVGVGERQRQRGHEPADVAEVDEVDELAGLHGAVERGAFPGLEPIAEGLVLVAVLVGRREAVVLVVEVLQLRPALDTRRTEALGLVAQRGLGGRELRRVSLTLERELHIRVLARDLVLAHAGHLDIDMVGTVEPTAPEPVQVDRRGVLHGAEEVGGRRALELPTGGVLAERVVEELAAHDEFAQHGERGGRLAVGVRPELHHRIGVGHDRHLVRRAHVRGDVVEDVGVLAERGEAGVPLDLGEVLEEGVEPLIHPGPLAFVAVDDHREVDVPDLVDDDADQAVLGVARIGELARLLVGGRPVPVEGDHRIFHAAALPAVDRDRDRVRVGEGEARIHLHGVHHGLRRILRPDRLALVWVEGHRHHERAGGVLLAVAHRIPDVFARARPSEIADVLRGEPPGAGRRRALILVLRRLGRGDDEHRSVGGLGALEPRALLGGENLAGVLQHARRGDHMVGGDGEFDIVVAELERELAAVEELLVLPAGVVGVGGEAGEPLRQEVLVGVVLREVFVAAAGADRRFVDDVEREVEGQLHRLAGLQRLREVDAHHGVVDGAAQRPTRAVPHRAHLVAVAAVLEGLMAAHRREAEAVPGTAAVPPRARVRGDFGAARDRVVLEDVLVELQPEVGQRVGRPVDVGDRLRSGDAVQLLVELRLDAVVGALLPIARAGRSRCAAGDARGGEQGLELRELLVGVPRYALHRGPERRRGEDGETEQGSKGGSRARCAACGGVHGGKFKG